MRAPEGWNSGVLGDAVVRAEYGSSAPTLESGTRPIIGMRNLREGTVSFENLAYIDDSAQDWSQLTLRVGDVLLNRTNSPDLVGKVGIVREVTDAVFASYLVRLVPDLSVVAPEYLNHWLNSVMVQGLIRKLATRGVSQANINPTVLRQHCPLLLPPLPEQRKIAEILRTWDDAIECMSRLRSAKLAFTRATLNGVVDSPLLHANVLLGDVFRERAEFGDASARLLSVTQNNGVIRHADAGRKDSSSADRSKYKRVFPGDIAYNTMRMWQGASGLVSEEGVVSPAYTVVVADVSRISPHFAAHLFKSERLKFEFERYSQGITSDTWNLKFPAFSRVSVPIPPLADQARMNDLLHEMHSEIALLDRELELLRTQKRGLMQKLLTGEVRVTLRDEESNG